MSDFERRDYGRSFNDAFTGMGNFILGKKKQETDLEHQQFQEEQARQATQLGRDQFNLSKSNTESEIAYRDKNLALQTKEAEDRILTSAQQRKKTADEIADAEREREDEESLKTFARLTPIMAANPQYVPTREEAYKLARAHGISEIPNDEKGQKRVYDALGRLGVGAAMLDKMPVNKTQYLTKGQDPELDQIIDDYSISMSPTAGFKIDNTTEPGKTTIYPTSLDKNGNHVPQLGPDGLPKKYTVEEFNKIVTAKQAMIESSTRTLASLKTPAERKEWLSIATENSLPKAKRNERIAARLEKDTKLKELNSFLKTEGTFGKSGKKGTREDHLISLYGDRARNIIEAVRSGGLDPATGHKELIDLPEKLKKEQNESIVANAAATRAKESKQLKTDIARMKLSQQALEGAEKARQNAKSNYLKAANITREDQLTEAMVDEMNRQGDAAFRAHAEATKAIEDKFDGKEKKPAVAAPVTPMPAGKKAKLDAAIARLRAVKPSLNNTEYNKAFKEVTAIRDSK